MAYFSVILQLLCSKKIGATHVFLCEYLMR
jgi:hypothetical protein